MTSMPPPPLAPSSLAYSDEDLKSLVSAAKTERSDSFNGVEQSGDYFDTLNQTELDSSRHNGYSGRDEAEFGYDGATTSSMSPVQRSMSIQIMNPPVPDEKGVFVMNFPVFLSSESFDVKCEMGTGRVFFIEILGTCPLMGLLQVGDEVVAVGGKSGDLFMVEKSKDLVNLIRDAKSREVKIRRPSCDLAPGRRGSAACVIC